MHKIIPLITFMLASLAALSGCSTLTSQELSRVGTTYELTEPACHADFSDGASILFPGKCITVVRSDALRKVQLPAGTCLKLGEPRILYPKLNREAVYEAEVAGLRSTISQLDSPRRPWKGMVKGTCTVVEAPPVPLSLR